MDSFHSRSTLKIGSKEYEIFRLDALDKQGISTKHLPFSLRILLENLLRFEDGRSVTKEDIAGCAAWLVNKGKTEKEIAFRPSRVLMQDGDARQGEIGAIARHDAELGLRAHRRSPRRARGARLPHAAARVAVAVRGRRRRRACDLAAARRSRDPRDRDGFGFVDAKKRRAEREHVGSGMLGQRDLSRGSVECRRSSATLSNAAVGTFALRSQSRRTAFSSPRSSELSASR